MLVIQGKNVNQVYHEAMWKIPIYGAEEQSRNGKALAVPYPVASVYFNPTERMLLDPVRDANPFFHVMEAMWMLAGENRVDMISKYAANIANYSDDGVTLNGAYGWRWREHFEGDQIEWVIQQLRGDPTSRRIVLGMWDPMEDPLSVTNGTADVPCNTHIYFRVILGELHMTVCCRSNDAVWGCYGANVVHMSFLQEYLAQAAGLKVGNYTQVSNNLHVYERHFNLLKSQVMYDPYTVNVENQHVPILGKFSHGRLAAELHDFLLGDTNTAGFDSPYVLSVLWPMRTAWDMHKQGGTREALDVVDTIADGAVRLACYEWLSRRVKK